MRCRSKISDALSGSCSQEVLDTGDGGGSRDRPALCLNHQPPARSDLRVPCGRLAGCALQGADVVVDQGQASLETGDGGAVVGQLLADHQRPLVRPQRLGRMVGRALQVTDVGVARGQVVLELAQVGEEWSSASFCQITSARSYDRSSSADWPVALCRRPMSLWLAARLFWNSESEGWSSASFWRITSAAALGTTASASDEGRPVARCLGCSPMSLWPLRQAALELGDGGVVVGQLLADHQRPLVRPPACPPRFEPISSVIEPTRVYASASSACSFGSSP